VPTVAVFGVHACTTTSRPGRQLGAREPPVVLRPDPPPCYRGGRMVTVGELLATAVERLRASGSDTPRLDAELLLARAVGTDRTGVIAHPDAPMGPEAVAAFAADVDRRATGEPVAYIRGLKEFHGVALTTDARALIPRPETELLVDAAVEEIVTRLAHGAGARRGEPIRVVDVGTGTGAVAIALAVALRRRLLLDAVELRATDISPDAVALARENAAAHGLLEVIRIELADLVPSGWGPFELVLANLPYIPTATLDVLGGSADHEPRLALDGGADGLDVIRLLLARLPTVLEVGGVALLEIGADQGEMVTTAARAAVPDAVVDVLPDLAGRPRVLRIERRPG
jgi:release factor glutamine methyltransferase